MKVISSMTDLWQKITALWQRYGGLAVTASIVTLWLLSLPAPPPARAEVDDALAIVGGVLDAQGQPVPESVVSLWVAGADAPAATTETGPDGSFILSLPPDLAEPARLEISHHHFNDLSYTLSAEERSVITGGDSLVLEDFSLSRSFGPAFWVATIIFVGMLVVMALERLHNALAALLAVSVIFAITFAGGAITDSLYIIDFEHDLAYIDFEVIFLLMGMMIVVGIIEETGIFQWLAYKAYQLSGGRTWLMTLILMVITGVITALLDNVATMLLITPITIQIALAMGVNPLALLFPALMASNVGGIATLIGTPTNILIGSYAGLGFTDFLRDLTPGVLMMMAGLFAFMMLYFRRERRDAPGSVSPALLKKLAENARIPDKKKLVKALIVLAFTLLLFIFGEGIHLTPAVSAIIGAVTMLLVVNPDIEEMMRVVDWTTLVFFMALFMVVGAIEEVGLVSTIAMAIRSVVGESAALASIVLLWSSSALSGVVDNIPFTLAMLPAVGYLNATVPGTANNILFYALAVGVATGGNFTLIASSPNLVVAGIAERAGYRISFMDFVRIGAPVTLITAAIGMAWVLLRFL